MTDTPHPVRVLIADDSDPVRHALRMMFESHPLIEVVGEAVDGIEAVELARELVPDVVLMDQRMPRLDGIAASRRLLEAPSNPRVVMLSAHSDPLLSAEALSIGVEHVLHKGELSTRLIAAVLGTLPTPRHPRPA